MTLWEPLDRDGGLGDARTTGDERDDGPERQAAGGLSAEHHRDARDREQRTGESADPKAFQSVRDREPEREERDQGQDDLRQSRADAEERPIDECVAQAEAQAAVDERADETATSWDRRAHQDHGDDEDERRGADP